MHHIMNFSHRSADMYLEWLAAYKLLYYRTQILEQERLDMCLHTEPSVAPQDYVTEKKFPFRPAYVLGAGVPCVIAFRGISIIS